MPDSSPFSVFQRRLLYGLLQQGVRNIRSATCYTLLSFLLLALPLFSGTAHAVAGITARVTLSTYPAFVAQNAAPGEVMFFWTNTANAGNNYGGVANNNTARLSISSNVTNATVNLGTTPGYFTVGFNNANYMGAVGCTTSPIDFNTSTPYTALGGVVDVTITCTVPDTTPPVKQSAATNTAGTTVTITFDEAVDSTPPVQVMSPTVRKRTSISNGSSPGSRST